MNFEENKKYSYAVAMLKLVVAMLVNLLLTRLAVERLSIDFAGIWFLFLSCVMYLSLFDFGLSEGLYCRISPLLGKESGYKEAAHWVFAYTVAYRKVITICFIVCSALGALLISLLMHNIELKRILFGYLIFILGVCFQLYSNFYYAIFYGYGKVIRQNYLRVFFLLLWTLISLIISHGFLGFCVAFVIKSASEAIFVGWSAYRELLKTAYFASLPGISLTGEYSLSIFKDSGQRLLVNLGSLLIFQSDIYIVAFVFGKQQVPYYYVAVQIFSILTVFARLYPQIALPKMLNLYGQERYEAFRLLFVKTLNVSMFFVLSSVLFIAAFNQEIISLWLGKGFHWSAVVLYIFLAIAVCEVWVGNFSITAKSLGYLKFYRVGLLMGVANIIISIILAYQVGIIGVPVATLLLELLLNIGYVCWVSIRFLKFKFTLVNTAFWRSVVFFVTAFAATYLIKASLPVAYSTLFGLLIAAGICGSIYLLLGYCIYFKNLLRQS